MTEFKVGKATIVRIEETYLPTYPVRNIFPACDDDIGGFTGAIALRNQESRQRFRLRHRGRQPYRS